MARYDLLRSAEIDAKYLHTNSTSHESVFGAMAEIVDNSRDAKAENLRIYTKPEPEFDAGFSLNFLDDGTGMDPDEAAKVMTFGSSIKDMTEESIGQYGNGLKSGAMHLGMDLIVFTKKDSVGTIIFVSRTFLDKIQVNKVKTPLPSFDLKSRGAYFSKNTENELRSTEELKTIHDLELEIILEYSPYKSIQELYAQFDLITGEHGTLVTIFNMITNTEGLCELDIESEPEDFMIRGVRVTHESDSQLFHKSFREFLSILYLNPSMKIYIQDKRVLTRRLDRCLYKPVIYEFTSNKFKSATEKARELAEGYLNRCKNDLRVCESKYNQKYDLYLKKEITHQEFVSFKRNLEKAKEALKLAEKNVEIKKREVNQYKKLNFIIGLNLENKYADGAFLYNSHRLVVAFRKPSAQEKDKYLKGIVAIVDIPYSILKPSQNKQKFQDTNEIKHLVDKLGEHMDCYSSYLNIDLNEFWGQYGYQNNFPSLPSSEELYRKRRMTDVKLTIQCTRCLKWRSLSLQSRYLNESFLDWTCRENPDTSKNSCSIPELLDPFPVQQYTKTISTYNEFHKSFENQEKEREDQKREREKKLAVEAKLSQPKFTNTSHREILSTAINSTNSFIANKKRNQYVTTQRINENDDSIDSDDSTDKNYNPRSAIYTNKSKFGKRACLEKSVNTVNRSTFTTTNKKAPSPSNEIEATISEQTSVSPISGHEVATELKAEKISFDNIQRASNAECSDSDSSKNQESLFKYAETFKNSYKRVLCKVGQLFNQENPEESLNKISDKKLASFDLEGYLGKVGEKLEDRSKKSYNKGIKDFSMLVKQFVANHLEATFGSIVELDQDMLQQITNQLSTKLIENINELERANIK